MATTIVPDTNVLISGTFWKGASCKVLMLVDEGKLRCCLCPGILEEYERILQTADIMEKSAEKGLLFSRIIARVREKSIMVFPSSISRAARDERDDHVLACAVAARADFLVTQDRDLLEIGRHGSVRIMTPESFLEQEKA